MLRSLAISAPFLPAPTSAITLLQSTLFAYAVAALNSSPSTATKKSPAVPATIRLIILPSHAVKLAKREEYSRKPQGSKAWQGVEKGGNACDSDVLVLNTLR